MNSWISYFSVTNSITSKTLKTTFISLLYHYRKCELHNQIYELEFEINVTLQSIHFLYYLYILYSSEQLHVSYVLPLKKQQKWDVGTKEHITFCANDFNPFFFISLSWIKCCVCSYIWFEWHITPDRRWNKYFYSHSSWSFHCAQYKAQNLFKMIKCIFFVIYKNFH